MGFFDIFKKGFEPRIDIDPPEKDEYPSREITIKENSFDKVSGKYPFLLLEFHADWCGPCKHMKPKVKWLAKELKGKVVVGTVDVERQKGLASRFKVRGIPRMILLHYGESVDSWMGARDISRISKELLRYHKQYEQTLLGDHQD